ncbi:MAG: head-tail connector protein [Treponema sp.]|jgi:hypothetical protein|nr:head-tail connector protein [Treponema sp.]
MADDRKEFIDEVKNRFEYLKSERQKREGDWKSVQQFVAPSIFDWDNPHNKSPQRPERYTSRPTNYLKTLRSGITGYSISPNIAWLKLGFENLDLATAHGAKDWLEAVEKVLYAEFNRSNLYPQNSKYIEFAATYGHAVMLIDEQLTENRLRFTNLNTQETFLDINEFDEVDTVFRRFVMSLKNASTLFGEDKLSGTRRMDLKDKKKWNNEITILHAVYKRDEYNDESTKATDMEYASIFIDYDGDHLIEESGYNEFPYAVFIWDTINGTAYGDSPAINALDDIVQLNMIDRAKMRIAQMSAFPAFNTPESMREEVGVVPNGHNYYKNKDELIFPINTGQNFPITLEAQRDMENRVKDWFYVDYFLALMNQRPQDLTATYVMQLQGEKAAVLSDLVVNLNNALTKIIQRSFNILWRQRKIPQPPEAINGSGAQLKVDFIGPLAQAQKKFHESAGINQGLQLIGAVGQLSPVAMDVIDFDQTLKSGLDGMGFPQSAIREDRDIEELRKERAQQEAAMQQQQQAMAQQEAIMENYGQMNEPVKQGSAIDQMNKVMQGQGVM